MQQVISATAKHDEVPFMRPVERDLRRVRTALRKTWQDAPPSIRPLVEHGAVDCGKLLRPALLLLSGRAFGPITQDHIRAATVLELIHNASLLHDDVLDQGLVRRGVATVNRRWGNRAAVLLGDWLLGKALAIGASLPTIARSALGRMIQRTCDGEMSQIASAGNLGLTEQQYLALITEKTAALFEGACYLGARLAGASHGECEAMTCFGCNAGIAYQMMDDLLDIVGDKEALSKTLGTDLQHGKLTLPLIHSIRMLSEPRRSSLLLKLETRRLSRPEALSVLGETGGTDYVLARIDACVRKAADAVRGIRHSLVEATLLEMPHWITRQVTEGMAKGFARTPMRRPASGRFI